MSKATNIYLRSYISESFLINIVGTGYILLESKEHGYQSVFYSTF